ncbi:unnamed protein product [Pleuronectes platessa]|uniref:Uncharacterized protein n=1 Tax=Pleuronectes platessa TaxID=8262 RepID=A0A9N7V585_PLEPL|nr:unnamed protein product [Pleuronectes platessa]
MHHVALSWEQWELQRASEWWMGEGAAGGVTPIPTVVCLGQEELSEGGGGGSEPAIHSSVVPEKNVEDEEETLSSGGGGGGGEEKNKRNQARTRVPQLNFYAASKDAGRSFNSPEFRGVAAQLHVVKSEKGLARHLDLC